MERQGSQETSKNFIENLRCSIPGDTIDISLGGLCCQVGPSLQENTQVRIYLQTGRNTGFTIESATVIQSEVHQGASRIQCQFNVAELPPELRELMNSTPPRETVWSSEHERRKSPRHLVMWTVGLDAWSDTF